MAKAVRLFIQSNIFFFNEIKVICDSHIRLDIPIQKFMLFQYIGQQEFKQWENKNF